MNEAGAFTNWAADEQSCRGNDIEQFGQLLATLLGHCHGSSEYIKVNFVQSVSFRMANCKPSGLPSWCSYVPVFIFSYNEAA